MAEVIRFFAPGEPPRVTAQQKGLSRRPGTRAHIYTTAQIKAVKKQFAKMFKPFAPAEPIAGALALEVDVVFMYRIEDLRTVKQREAADLGERIICAVKPDADNVVKEIQDALEAAGFFTNDSHVWALSVRKWFGAAPGIDVKITPAGVELDELRS